MSRRARAGAVLLLSALGCSEPAQDDVAPVELPEVCGEPGPVRLLGLAASETVTSLQRTDDDGRLLALVQTRAETEAPGAAGEVVAHRVVLLGPCGEAPTVVATDVTQVDVDGGVLLGCDEASRTLYRLDPAGVQDPTLLVAPVSCSFWTTPHGLVVVEAEAEEAWGRLLLVSPDDGAAEELLPARVRVPARRSGPLSIHVQDDRVIALTRDSEVVHISLDDRMASVRITEAADARVSSDGSTLLWQAGPVQPDVTVRAEGTIVAQSIEASANEGAAIATAYLGWSARPFFDDYIVLRTQAGGAELAFTWPGLDPVPLPPGAAVRGQSPQGGLWYGVGDPSATQEWLLGAGGPAQLLYEGPGYPGSVDAGLEMFVPGPQGSLQSGALVFVPWEGGPAQTLAVPVHFSRVRLEGGAVLSVDALAQDAHGFEVGELFVHPAAIPAPASSDGPSPPSDRFSLAQQVDVDSLALNRRRPVDTDFVYRIVGTQGAGLWRARLQ